MKKTIVIIACLISFHFCSAQNVGIGISTPTAKLDVNGNMKVEGTNTLEFGAGVFGKETNAGKIGYNSFGSSDGFTIVGAGTNATNRKVYFYAEGGTTFNGPVNTPATGSANMLPVCYGSVDGTTNPATIMTGSGNFTVTRPYAGLYYIQIAGKTLTDFNHTALVSCIRRAATGGAVLWTFAGVAPANVDGALYINTSDASDQKFSFVVYMPQ